MGLFDVRMVVDAQSLGLIDEESLSESMEPPFEKT
jgi:hypothetical protein